MAFTGIAASGDRHQIVGCDIHDTGNIGVSLKSGDRTSLVRGDSLVDNCHIHHTNRIVRRAVRRAVSIDGVGIRISRNLIHDVGYIGIGFIGNDTSWSTTASSEPTTNQAREVSAIYRPRLGQAAVASSATTSSTTWKTRGRLRQRHAIRPPRRFRTRNGHLRQHLLPGLGGGRVDLRRSSKPRARQSLRRMPLGRRRGTTRRRHVRKRRGGRLSRRSQSVRLGLLGQAAHTLQMERTALQHKLPQARRNFHTRTRLQLHGSTSSSATSWSIAATASVKDR